MPGMRRSKRVPRPSSLVRAIVPPSRSQTWRMMERPRPVPTTPLALAAAEIAHKLDLLLAEQYDDTLELSRLKKAKLRVKDLIQRLSRRNAGGTA